MLRPFPQFGDVKVFERTEGGRRQYHAATFVLQRRASRSWWGGRYSYTWSRLDDNQFGESSAYQTRTAIPQNVYDLDAEYARSNSDSPHRIVLAPIVRLPSPAAGTRSFWALGGWNLSAIVERPAVIPGNRSRAQCDRHCAIHRFQSRNRSRSSSRTSGGISCPWSVPRMRIVCFI